MARDRLFEALRDALVVHHCEQGWYHLTRGASAPSTHQARGFAAAVAQLEQLEPSLTRKGQLWRE
jgi:hypothetical protein